MLVRFSPIKNRKISAPDGFDTFPFIAAFLMTSLKRTARPKMAALTVVLSRLLNVYFWQAGRENGVKKREKKEGKKKKEELYIFFLNFFFNSVCVFDCSAINRPSAACSLSFPFSGKSVVRRADNNWT